MELVLIAGGIVRLVDRRANFPRLRISVIFVQTVALFDDSSMYSLFLILFKSLPVSEFASCTLQLRSSYRRGLFRPFAR